MMNNDPLIKKIDLLLDNPQDISSEVKTVLRLCRKVLTDYDLEFMTNYAHSLEEILDKDPYPSADAYDHACGILEKWHEARAKKQLPLLTQGSLCDGLSSILHSYDELEYKLRDLEK